MSCGSYRGIKLMEHARKVLERVVDKRLSKITDIEGMQFGFMKGHGTTCHNMACEADPRENVTTKQQPVLCLCGLGENI